MLRIATFSLLLLPLAYPQDSTLRFEVASVKRVDIAPVAAGILAPQVSGGPGTSSPTQLIQRGVWLRSTIAQAFDVDSEDVSGPGWMSSERYEILATVPAGATKEQVKVMMQNLLYERFHLKFRRGTTKKGVYALRVGKNGLKMQPSSPAQVPAEETRSLGNDAEGYPILPASYKGWVGMPSSGRLLLSGRNSSMADFARMLRDWARSPVVDETGLTGLYDFRMSHQMGPRPAPGTAAPTEAGPTLFDEVESLGLRLDRSESTFPTITIESLDREPTVN